MNDKNILVTDQNIETSTEEKFQYILNEYKELTQIPKSKCTPVEYPIKCNLINAFEVFVRVDFTENYWISNYGRCLSNIRKKNSDTFYEHKTGKCHYTIYEIQRCIVGRRKTKKKTSKLRPSFEKIIPNTTEEKCNKILEELQSSNDKFVYTVEVDRSKTETSPDALVAKHFLVKNKGDFIWHIDGNENNNWYKNLMYVTGREYDNLKSGKITCQEIDRKQEYIEYENKATHKAFLVYNGIATRCKNTSEDSPYKNTSMCQEWRDNPRSFVKWYLEHYYTCGDESLAVDKDLFGDGTCYSPDACCIVPQTINTALSNCKKHYLKGQTPDNTLPLGVAYSNKRGKYYSDIQLFGTSETIKLCEHDTPEEAFKEYKIIKEADIKLLAVKYKDKIPERVYKKLLEVEVMPY